MGWTRDGIEIALPHEDKELEDQEIRGDHETCHHLSPLLLLKSVGETTQAFSGNAKLTCRQFADLEATKITIILTTSGNGTT
jgi:hypothetical protein